MIITGERQFIKSVDSGYQFLTPILSLVCVVCMHHVLSPLRKYERQHSKKTRNSAVDDGQRNALSVRVVQNVAQNSTNSISKPCNR